jgi:hypothetical protein
MKGCSNGGFLCVDLESGPGSEDVEFLHLPEEVVMVVGDDGYVVGECKGWKVGVWGRVAEAVGVVSSAANMEGAE